MIEPLLNYGPFHRIWPAADRIGNIYITVSSVRSFANPICKFFKSDDLGNSWIELADFLSMDEKNSTTGQPFVSREGLILASVWDSSYYQFGKTWLAIYRSNDDGLNWDIVYSNPAATYGKHFFEGDRQGEVYLCAGIGGGGSEGEVHYAPARGLLLRSLDSGKSWDICLEVDSPTALYDGTVSNGITIVSARERGSIFRSDDSAKTWSEVRLGAAARNVSRIGSNIVVSSDSAIFISRDEGCSWIKRKSPLRNLVLRYPTLLQDQILMTGVGWRSLILATDLEGNEWRISLDATKFARSKFMTRLATAREYFFLGDEIEAGVLLRVAANSLKRGHTFPYSILSRLGSIDDSFDAPRLGFDARNT